MGSTCRNPLISVKCSYDYRIAALEANLFEISPVNNV